MARIEVALPDKKIFSVDIAVRVSDLNYGGHVGHDAILTLMQEARVLFYQTLGVKDELSFEGRIGQIITDVAIQYKSEAFLEDVLVFDISLAHFNKYGFTMYYNVTNRSSMKQVAKGQTGIVCFDYDKKKIASLPESFLEKLNTAINNAS
jgi:YbgC/YbaW family acyl-CoA thioester hydrolase